jgi:hypothetical protein
MKNLAIAGSTDNSPFTTNLFQRVRPPELEPIGFRKSPPQRRIIAGGPGRVSESFANLLTTTPRGAAQSAWVYQPVEYENRPCEVISR